MSAARLLARCNGMAGDARPGEGFVSLNTPKVVATDANYQVLAGDIASGCLQFTGLTAGRNLTVPTAVTLEAAFPEVGNAESLELLVSIVPAFALTLVAATGVTLAGKATVVASGHAEIYFTKTSAGAWVARVL